MMRTHALLLDVVVAAALLVAGAMATAGSGVDVAAAASITATGGTPQSTTISTAFAAALEATVTDSGGNPVSGVVVTFAAPGGGASASLSSTTATTDASGIASVTATANTSAGSYTVTASAPGVATPASFDLTNTVGAAASITATGGTPQSTTISTAFAAALQATVADSGGNPVSGEVVTFAAPGGGASASLSSTTATTDASGIASVTATANTSAGSYTVTASAPGVATPASFALTNTAAAASITATGGTPQSTTISTAFAAALEATVADSGGNPVSGVVVTFAAPGGGASASLSSTTATTNASGIASVTATANASTGAYTVKAKAPGVATLASFALTNTVAAAILTHGPVVGGVTPLEAKVFVRTDRPASVQLHFSADPNLANASVTSSLQTSSISDFTAIVPLTGLSPQTTYYLNVAVDGVPQLSPSFPSFSTFPTTTTPQPFKFIILTDFTRQDIVTLAVPTFLNASDEQAAFTFIGGDFDHRNPVSLTKKRTMFKQLYNPNSVGLADFVNRILRKMPIVHQWDDHDAGKNNINKTYTAWDLSYQAFVEYVPTYEMPLTPPGIWQRFSYAHVDFFVLDSRSQRDPNTDPDDDNKSMLDGNNLGATGQLEWLKNGLLGSSARWKVVFSGVPTNPTAKPMDSYGAFQIEWGKIRTFIETNGITGVVFISGDMHLGGIDNGNAAGFPEMVVTTANGAASGALCQGAPGVWSEGFYRNLFGHCDGYGVVTVLTDPDQLLFEVKDENGAVRLSFAVF